MGKKGAVCLPAYGIECKPPVRDGMAASVIAFSFKHPSPVTYVAAARAPPAKLPPMCFSRNTLLVQTSLCRFHSRASYACAWCHHLFPAFVPRQIHHSLNSCSPHAKRRSRLKAPLHMLPPPLSIPLSSSHPLS